MTPKTYLGNLAHIDQAAPAYAAKHRLVKMGIAVGVSAVAALASGYIYDRKVTFPGYEKIFWSQN